MNSLQKLASQNVQQKSLKPTLPKWKWTPECQNAFEMLVEKLSSPPILAYANYDLPFMLHTDVSCDGLGAVLYQTQGGKEHVVAYASRGLRKGEKNYPAHELDFLALKWAITEKLETICTAGLFMLSLITTL